MLVMPEFQKPYSITSLTSPIVIKYHWVFSAHQLDWMLGPINYLEDTTGPLVRVMIEGFEFDIPAAWNILIVDDDTYTVDTVPLSKCATTQFKAFLMSPSSSRITISTINVVDFIDEGSVVHPLVQKATSFCHPVGPMTIHGKEHEMAVTIGPHDLNRWLYNKAIGDLLSF